VTNSLTAPVGVVDPVAVADAVADRVAGLLRQEQQLAPLLVDVAGAARLLSMSVNAFRSRLQRGQIPPSGDRPHRNATSVPAGTTRS